MAYRKIEKGILEVTREVKHQVTLDSLKADKENLERSLLSIQDELKLVNEMIKALEEKEEK